MTAMRIDQELIGLEKAYWDAMKTNDVPTVLRLTDGVSLLANSSGVNQLDQALLKQVWESAPGMMTLNDYNIDDATVKVQQITNDVVVIAYKVHEDMTVEGKPVQIDAFDTTTWVRRNGQWTCAAHTESIAGDPFGRGR
jgi:hypothetical protein